MHKTAGLYFFFSLFGLSLQAQIVYTIEDLVFLYTSNGYDVKNNYAQYQVDSLTQKNNRNKYKIESKLSFSVPYAKAIESVMQPDGSNKLLQTNYISPMMQLSLRKKVVFLGGELSLSSSFNGYANFINGDRQYGSNWFNLQYSQDFFKFNEYKYEIKKIKLQQEKDKHTLLYSNLEDVTSFIELIFQYYIDRQLLEENSKNIENNQALLEKTRTLFKNGKAMAADTLNTYLLVNKLQIQRNELEAQKRLVECKIKYKTLLHSEFEISVDNSPLMLNLETDVLTERYLKYTLQKDADLEIFELESEIARSRKNTGITTAVSLGMGINSKAEEYIYDLTNGRPADKENISLNLTLPISGWNSQKNNKKIASLNKEIYLREQENNKQEANLWAQEIIVKYKQLLSLIELANKNLEASRELERILIKNIENGKSDYIALYQLYVNDQVILLEKYKAIRDIYILKYDLIKNTFFDFESNSSLENYIK